MGRSGLEFVPHLAAASIDPAEHASALQALAIEAQEVNAALYDALLKVPQCEANRRVSTGGGGFIESQQRQSQRLGA